MRWLGVGPLLVYLCIICWLVVGYLFILLSNNYMKFQDKIPSCGVSSVGLVVGPLLALCWTCPLTIFDFSHAFKIIFLHITYLFHLGYIGKKTFWDRTRSPLLQLLENFQ